MIDILRKPRFERELKSRKISRLCHITKSIKALHILSSADGVVAVDFLDKDLYDANDTLRLDGKTDFINCSIEYPNHWYWRKVKDDKEMFRDWVILLINPSLISDETTSFCALNAATARGAYVEKGYEAFEKLFSNQVGRLSRTANMLPCCSTNDQAEVLIHRNIARKDIIGVVVRNETQAVIELARWSCLDSIPEIDIIIAEDLFNGNWSSMVRQGKRPLEFSYNGGQF